MRLYTGRSHQIRAHLRTVNLPVAGDKKYGDERTNSKFRRNFALNHQFLFAYRAKLSGAKEPLSYLAEKEFTALPGAGFMNVLRGVFGEEAVKRLFEK